MEFSADVVGGYANSGYQGGSADQAAAPLVQLETKWSYICGLSAGVKLYVSADQSQEALLGTTYLRDYGLRPNDSDGTRSKRLDRRRNTVMVDISCDLYSPYDSLGTQVSHDVSGMNKGIQAQAQYSYFWQPTPKLLIKPTAGVPYLDKEFNRYYYSINADEARRNGLNAYQPKSSVHPYIGLEVQYSFTPKFSAFAGVLVEALPSTVKNDPMNGGRYRIEGTVGLMYRF